MSKVSGDIEKLGELIKDIQVAMLITVKPDGSLRGRPMMTQRTPFDGDLWFVTRRDTMKVEEIQENQHVNLSYADPDNQMYVSVSGRANLVVDRNKATELWHAAYKAWFPDGVDDPQMALLRVHVERAEYWDSSSSTMVHLVGFVKAAVIGQPYRPGEQGEITL